MQQILVFLDAYRVIVGAAVVSLVLVAVIARWWDQVKLFWKSFWYSIPGFGKIASVSRDTAIDKSGWFRSEKILCDDFYSDISNFAADPDMFDRAHSYLGKAQERGRSELGIFMWILLVLIVFVEALGFAYVLSGYTLPGASEKMQVQGAFGIAFLISAVLVFLTHSAGKELHRRGLVKIARTWWIHDGNENRPNLVGGNSRVSLASNQVDDDEPTYLQLVNRLNTNATVTPDVPIWTIATVLAILIVGSGATIVRYETYVQDKTAESMLETPSTTQFTLKDLTGGLPSVLTTPKAKAEKQGEAEKNAAQDTANLTTFAILAVLFTLIQFIGVGVGYRTGFAGRESRQARRIIGNFNSRSEYESWYGRKRDVIARIAQKNLSKLQGKLTTQAQLNSVDRNDREIIHRAADRTFMVHFEMRAAQEEANRRQNEGRRQEAKLYREKGAAEDAKRRMAPAPNNDLTDKEARDRAELEAEKRAPEKEESCAEMEARLRAELEIEEAQSVETEDEMRARLRREMGMA